MRNIQTDQKLQLLQLVITIFRAYCFINFLVRHCNLTSKFSALTVEQTPNYLGCSLVLQKHIRKH